MRKTLESAGVSLTRVQRSVRQQLARYAGKIPDARRWQGKVCRNSLRSSVRMLPTLGVGKSMLLLLNLCSN